MKMFLTLAAVLLTASFASAEFKLAYVDVQKAIEKSVSGKKAKEEMKKEAEKKNKDLEKKKADIDKMREDFEKKKSVLAEEALAKKAQELQEEMQKFNVVAQKAQKELITSELDKALTIITRAAKLKHLDKLQLKIPNIISRYTSEVSSQCRSKIWKNRCDITITWEQTQQITRAKKHEKVRQKQYGPKRNREVQKRTDEHTKRIKLNHTRMTNKRK